MARSLVACERVCSAGWPTLPDLRYSTLLYLFAFHGWLAGHLLRSACTRSPAGTVELRWRRRALGFAFLFRRPPRGTNGGELLIITARPALSSSILLLASISPISRCACLRAGRRVRRNDRARCAACATASVLGSGVCGPRGCDRARATLQPLT